MLNLNKYGSQYGGVIALSLILSACQPAVETEKAAVIRPAKLITVRLASAVKNYSFPAVVAAATARDLAFQVSGQMLELAVELGEEVKKGALIAKLDSRQFNNELQTAQTQFDNAQSEFARAERLLAEDAIAKNVFEQRKTQLKISAAQLDNANKALEDTRLYAPFAGVIAAKLAEQLETVGPSKPVVSLQTLGATQAVVKIPASLVAKSKHIKPIESLVFLDVAADLSLPATFIEASPLADEKSQTFAAKFSFTPPDSLRVLPGMTGTVRAKLSFTDASVAPITVPLNAVLSDGGGQYVWLASGEPLTVSRRDVTVAASVGEWLLIESGLTEGDEIVAAGAAYLFAGMQIRRLEN